MKKFFSEFKEFINRGNVMDLAVAVIIGGAFTSIVTALTTNIINPLISVIAGGGADTISGLVVPGTDIDFGASSAPASISSSLLSLCSCS